MSLEAPSPGPPSSIDALLTAARSALRARDLSTAEKTCAEALALDPANMQAKTILGSVAGQTGRYEQAISILSEVVRSQPSMMEANHYLAVNLRLAGRLDDALDVSKRVVELAPKFADGHACLGLCYKALRRPAESADSFRRALELNPSILSFHYELGLALMAQNKPTDAEACFRRATELSPDSMPPWLLLSKLLGDAGRKTEAAPVLRRLHRLEPNPAASRIHLAQALLNEDNPAEAETVLREVISAAPPAIQARMLLGLVLKELGRFEESLQVCREIIEIDPRNATAYLDLVQGVKVGEGDRGLVERMRSLAEAKDLGVQDQVNLRYALGKSLDDLGDYGEAMAEFDQANGLMHRFNERVNGPFNYDEHVRHTEVAMRTFGKEFIDRTRAFGSPSEQPVLVVGMIRSGTTLLEQILASHPGVWAGGENTFWMKPGDAMVSPDGVMFSKAHIQKIADSYQLRLSGGRTGDLRITDKMPLNYRYIGVIHATFPNARIIHCRRHPVDNCVSIYSTPFSSDWAHNKPQIVFVYKEYLRLMEYWRRMLPRDRFIEVDYEQVVTDRERISRELIEFIGLDWNDAMLSFKGSEGQVQTPSVWQARQPLYTTSVERWRRYAPWLEEFKDLLTDAERASIEP